ncbi:hypothetical protein, partial [Staphylococcus aureus]|uniref:hypothetical protein n=1 Tax=Staphylococcus aureus TaxID=1280 RepID=UPI001C2E9B5A
MGKKVLPHVVADSFLSFKHGMLGTSFLSPASQLTQGTTDVLGSLQVSPVAAYRQGAGVNII